MKSRYRLTLELVTLSASAGDGTEAVGGSGERRLQINLRGILLAFAWTAVWGVGWAWSESFLDGNNGTVAEIVKQIVFST